jgi:SAM-dependent methyltransferase
MSAAYDDYLVPAMFRPYAEDLAARVAVLAPRRVLELAAGTGVATSLLVERLPDAQITATDFNQAMVDVGAVRAPTATWQQADANDLPFDDASFDCVVCQFGVMFFHGPAAYSEIRRMLSPGGRFVFNSWGRLEDHDFEDEVIKSMARQFPEDPPTFLADVPHGYCDPDVITAEIEAAGLVCESIELVELTSMSPSAADLARGFSRGTPLRAQIEARGDLDEARVALQAHLEARFGTGPVTGRMTAYVAVASA